MPKDSQPDNKKAREIKSKGQTPITRENMKINSKKYLKKVFNFFFGCCN